MKMAKRLLRCNTQMHVLHVINHPSKTKSSKPGLRETSTLFLFTHSTMWWSSRLSPQKFRFCRFQILGTHLRCFSWWKFNDHFKKIISNLEFPQKKETPLLNHFAPSFGLSVAIDKPACTIRTGVWLMNRSLLNPFFGGRMSLDVTTIHQDRLTRDPVHLSEPWILEHIFGDTCSSQVSHVFVFNKQGYRDFKKKHEKTWKNNLDFRWFNFFQERRWRVGCGLQWGVRRCKLPALIQWKVTRLVNFSRSMIYDAVENALLIRPKLKASQCSARQCL